MKPPPSRAGWRPPLFCVVLALLLAVSSLLSPVSALMPARIGAAVDDADSGLAFLAGLEANPGRIARVELANLPYYRTQITTMGRFTAGALAKSVKIGGMTYGQIPVFAAAVPYPALVFFNPSDLTPLLTINFTTVQADAFGWITALHYSPDYLFVGTSSGYILPLPLTALSTPDLSLVSSASIGPGGTVVIKTLAYISPSSATADDGQIVGSAWPYAGPLTDLRAVSPPNEDGGPNSGRWSWFSPSLTFAFIFSKVTNVFGNFVVRSVPDDGAVSAPVPSGSFPIYPFSQLYTTYQFASDSLVRLLEGRVSKIISPAGLLRRTHFALTGLPAAKNFTFDLSPTVVIDAGLRYPSFVGVANNSLAPPAAAAIPFRQFVPADLAGPSPPSASSSSSPSSLQQALVNNLVDGAAFDRLVTLAGWTVTCFVPDALPFYLSPTAPAISCLLNNETISVLTGIAGPPPMAGYLQTTATWPSMAGFTPSIGALFPGAIQYLVPGVPPQFNATTGTHDGLFRTTHALAFPVAGLDLFHFFSGTYNASDPSPLTSPVLVLHQARVLKVIEQATFDRVTVIPSAQLVFPAPSYLATGVVMPKTAVSQSAWSSFIPFAKPSSSVQGGPASAAFPAAGDTSGSLQPRSFAAHVWASTAARMDTLHPNYVNYSVLSSGPAPVVVVSAVPGGQVVATGVASVSSASFCYLDELPGPYSFSLFPSTLADNDPSVPFGSTSVGSVYPDGFSIVRDGLSLIFSAGPALVIFDLATMQVQGCTVPSDELPSPPGVFAATMLTAAVLHPYPPGVGAIDVFIYATDVDGYVYIIPSLTVLARAQKATRGSSGVAGLVTAVRYQRSTTEPHSTVSMLFFRPPPQPVAPSPVVPDILLLAVTNAFPSGSPAGGLLPVPLVSDTTSSSYGLIDATRRVPQLFNLFRLANPFSGTVSGPGSITLDPYHGQVLVGTGDGMLQRLYLDDLILTASLPAGNTVPTVITGTAFQRMIIGTGSDGPGGQGPNAPPYKGGRTILCMQSLHPAATGVGLPRASLDVFNTATDLPDFGLANSSRLLVLSLLGDPTYINSLLGRTEPLTLELALVNVEKVAGAGLKANATEVNGYRRIRFTTAARSGKSYRFRNNGPAFSGPYSIIGSGLCSSMVVEFAESAVPDPSSLYSTIPDGNATAVLNPIQTSFSTQRIRSVHIAIPGASISEVQITAPVVTSASSGNRTAPMDGTVYPQSLFATPSAAEASIEGGMLSVNFSAFVTGPSGASLSPFSPSPMPSPSPTPTPSPTPPVAPSSNGTNGNSTGGGGGGGNSNAGGGANNEPAPEDASFSRLIIILGAFCASLFLMVLVVAFFVLRRRKATEKQAIEEQVLRQVQRIRAAEMLLKHDASGTLESSPATLDALSMGLTTKALVVPINTTTTAAAAALPAPSPEQGKKKDQPAPRGSAAAQLKQKQAAEALQASLVQSVMATLQGNKDDPTASAKAGEGQNSEASEPPSPSPSPATAVLRAFAQQLPKDLLEAVIKETLAEAASVLSDKRKLQSALVDAVAEGIVEASKEEEQWQEGDNEEGEEEERDTLAPLSIGAVQGEGKGGSGNNKRRTSKMAFSKRRLAVLPQAAILDAITRSALARTKEALVTTRSPHEERSETAEALAPILLTPESIATLRRLDRQVSRMTARPFRSSTGSTSSSQGQGQGSGGASASASLRRQTPRRMLMPSDAAADALLSASLLADKVSGSGSGGGGSDRARRPSETRVLFSPMQHSPRSRSQRIGGSLAFSTPSVLPAATLELLEEEKEQGTPPVASKTGQQPQQHQRGSVVSANPIRGARPSAAERQEPSSTTNDDEELPLPLSAILAEVSSHSPSSSFSAAAFRTSAVADPSSKRPACVRSSAAIRHIETALVQQRLLLAGERMTATVSSLSSTHPSASTASPSLSPLLSGRVQEIRSLIESRIEQVKIRQEMIEESRRASKSFGGGISGSNSSRRTSEGEGKEASDRRVTAAGAGEDEGEVDPVCLADDKAFDAAFFSSPLMVEEGVISVDVHVHVHEGKAADAGHGRAPVKTYSRTALPTATSGSGRVNIAKSGAVTKVDIEMAAAARKACAVSVKGPSGVAASHGADAFVILAPVANALEALVASTLATASKSMAERLVLGLDDNDANAAEAMQDLDGARAVAGIGMSSAAGRGNKQKTSSNDAATKDTASRLGLSEEDGHVVAMLTAVAVEQRREAEARKGGGLFASLCCGGASDDLSDEEDRGPLLPSVGKIRAMTSTPPFWQSSALYAQQKESASDLEPLTASSALLLDAFDAPLLKKDKGAAAAARGQLAKALVQKRTEEIRRLQAAGGGTRVAGKAAVPLRLATANSASTLIRPGGGGSGRFAALVPAVPKTAAATIVGSARKRLSFIPALSLTGDDDSARQPRRGSVAFQAANPLLSPNSPRVLPAPTEGLTSPSTSRRIATQQQQQLANSFGPTSTSLVGTGGSSRRGGELEMTTTSYGGVRQTQENSDDDDGNSDDGDDGSDGDEVDAGGSGSSKRSSRRRLRHGSTADTANASTDKAKRTASKRNDGRTSFAGNDALAPIALGPRGASSKIRMVTRKR